MKKTFLMMVILAFVAIIQSCANEPFVPPSEDELPCYITIENRTGYDMAWDFRKSSEPMSLVVSITDNKENGWSKADKHEKYILDVYLLGGYINEVDASKLRTTRSIIISRSYEISTETEFTHTITFTYTAGNLVIDDR